MAATVEESKIGEHLFLTPKVPRGLAAAVEGLTREVIRHRPDNIYTFAAHHFEKLLQLREQYDVEGSANDNDSGNNIKSRPLLRSTNEAIKEREGVPRRRRHRHNCAYSKQQREPVDDYCTPNGWSLNETAKVLERHRSIFGDSGQKISTEQVRELANRTESITSKLPKSQRDGVTAYNHRLHRSSSLENAERPASKKRDSDDSSKHESSSKSSPPKIISQIPLTKDIKSELKKHRRSSKERKKDEKQRVHACSDKRSTETRTTESTTKKSVEKTKRSLEIIRSEQRKCSSRSTESISIKRKTDVVIRDKVRASPSTPATTKKAPTSFSSSSSTSTTTTTTTNTTTSSSSSSSTKPSNMDRIKSQTVQNFASMSSIEELQSPSYVEKVQEVINETSTIIKEKVEALKTDFVKVARVKHAKKERSSSSEEQSAKLSGQSIKSDDKKAQKVKSRETSSSSSSTPSSSSSRHSSKNIDLPKKTSTTPNILKSCKSFNENADKIESKALNYDQSDDESKISLPAVKPPSSKSSSRSVSARSASADDGLVLPPISPESAKSTKVQEELVLPALSPPHSSAVTPDSLNSDVDKNLSKAKGFYDEEEFQDSLNVTPDLLDEKQRPDSLEPPEIMGIAKKSDASGHVSPAETLKDKLMEIEEVQQRILRNTVISDDDGDDDDDDDDKHMKTAGDATIESSSDIQGKLKEIQDSEKRIEKILKDSQTTSLDEKKITNIDIKKKLEELEDAGKRIETIIDRKSEEKLAKDKTDRTKVNVGQEIKQSASDMVTISKDREDVEGEGKNQSEINVKSNEAEKISEKIEDRKEVLSPHCYILTEGSPYEIPDTVTTVIIPVRTPTPDSASSHWQLEDEQIYATLVSSPKESRDIKSFVESEIKRKISMDDAFGEAIDIQNLKNSTVDTDYMNIMETSNDLILSSIQMKDLDLIKEERDKETNEIEDIDSEDEKVLKVVTSSLEEILETDKVEYVPKVEVQALKKSSVSLDEEKDVSPLKSDDSAKIEPKKEKKVVVTGQLAEAIDVDEHSLDIEGATLKSTTESITDEFKETSIASDRSSLTLDQFTIPIVPELNLDSLPDLSSLDEQKEDMLKGLVDMTVDRIERTSDESSEVVVENNEKIREKVGEIWKEDEEVEKEITTIKVTEKLQSTEESVKESTGKHEIDKKAESWAQSKSDTTESNNSEANGKTATVIAIGKGNLREKQIMESTGKLMTNASSVEKLTNSKILDSLLDITNNFVINESQHTVTTTRRSSEQTTMEVTSLKENKNVSICEAVNLESLTRELVEPRREEKIRIEQQAISADTIDNNGQLVGLPTISSSCQRTIVKRQQQIDSIEASTTNELEKNPSLEIVTKEDDKEVVRKKIERQATYDKSSTDHDGESHEIKEPEVSENKDLSSSTLITTSRKNFITSITKIQAGVRGFLTRRRLHSAQCRSSTLDSVPSIQESELTVDAQEDNVSPETPDSIRSSRSDPALLSLISVIGVTKSMAESKRCRKKLSREDALQQRTLSLENAFADKHLQHTGEFHDCIPLPVFDLGLKVPSDKSQSQTTSVASDAKSDERDCPSRDKNMNVAEAGSMPQYNGTDHPRGKPGPSPSNVEELLSKILMRASPSVTKLSPFVDVVLLPGNTEAMLQSGYLNFITSVEDVFNETASSDTPKGVIIEEITSLDDEKIDRVEKDSLSASTAGRSEQASIENTAAESGARSETTTTSEKDTSNEKKRTTSSQISSSSLASSGVLNTDKAAAAAESLEGMGKEETKHYDDLLEQKAQTKNNDSLLTSVEKEHLVGQDESLRVELTSTRITPTSVTTVTTTVTTGSMQSSSQWDSVLQEDCETITMQAHSINENNGASNKTGGEIESKQ